MERVLVSDSGALMLDGNGIKAVQAKIAAEFEKARMQEFEYRERVKEYAKPGVVDPVLVAQEKDAVLETFYREVERASEGIEIIETSAPKKPLIPLAKQAHELVQEAAKTAVVYHRKKEAVLHVIESDFTGSLTELLKECDEALGFKPKRTITPDALKCNLTASETKKKRFWQR